MPLKGKRFIGRLGRDLTDAQKLMALSVIVNRIEQVDVIRNAAILDSIEDSRDRRNVEKQAYAFQEHVVNQGLQLSPATRTLKTYTALIEMMIENGAAFARVVRTRVRKSSYAM
jgi:DNA topoisomerase 2-associated protein PAT1